MAMDDQQQEQFDQTMMLVVEVLERLRVSTDLFTAAMHRFEDRAKEERDDVARLLDIAKSIDIRLGVVLEGLARAA